VSISAPATREKCYFQVALKRRRSMSTAKVPFTSSPRRTRQVYIEGRHHHLRKTFLFVIAAASLIADQLKYQKPSKEVLDVLNAPAPPVLAVNPTGTYGTLSQMVRYPSTAEIAEPILRIAGMRIDPRTNGVELWLGDPSTGKARKVSGLALNALVGDPIDWMPDDRTLVVRAVPFGRGPVPEQPKVPVGPHVQESAGHAMGMATYEDLLQNPRDEDLYEYHATSQLVFGG
jgi:hypothetical protein